MQTKKLNDGVEIPVYGFGTFQIPADGSTYKAVREALDLGIRHIDTAVAYFNEVICCELQMSDILANVVNLADLYIC